MSPQVTSTCAENAMSLISYQYFDAINQTNLRAHFVPMSRWGHILPLLMRPTIITGSSLRIAWNQRNNMSLRVWMNDPASIL